MKRKIGIYLLALSMFLGLLVPMAPAQAAGTPDISGKTEGLEPLISLEMTEVDEEVFASHTETATYNVTDAEKAYWSQFSGDYYYKYYLNDVEKAFWDGMEKVSLDIATSTAYCGYYADGSDYELTTNAIVNHDTSISRTRRAEIIWMFQYTNPQYYFWANVYMNGTGAIGLFVYPEFADGTSRKAATQRFTNKVDQWVAEINSCARPDEKVKRAHDIMCENTVYEFNDLDQTAYSLVCNGITVCAGYSKTTNLLLTAAGIDSVVMLGPGHAWNAVRVHDIWYEMDVTWDDQDWGYGYWYYNKSNQTFIDEGHEKESPYLYIDLDEDYDSAHYYDYINPYFTAGGNTYFVVNDNTALGQRLVKRIAGSAALPQTVSYTNKTYYVIQEPGTSVPQGDVASLRAFVERMYTVALGRTADASGLDYWTNSLVSLKDDGASLSSGFILSPEFASRNYTNEQYLKVLYKTFFNREADSAGLNFWLNEMSSGKNRAYVLSGFVNSNEFSELCTSYGIERGILRTNGIAINPGARRFTERLYVEVLNRNADQAGVEYWASAISDGTQTPINAATSFFFSEEYLAKGTSNEKFIKTLYRTFMGRDADDAGMSYWMIQLANGVSRQSVMEGFAYSEEFKQIMASYGL